MTAIAPPSNSTTRVLFASMVGTTIEFFDFYIYATAAVLVFPHLFFPGSDPTVSTLQSLATFALAFFARPVGSVLFGHFGDRIGRKATLVAALLTMGVSTVVIGLLPTYDSIGVVAPVLLALCRLGQGIGLGGEWGGAVLLATEHAPPGKRAWFGMFPQLGAPLGFLLATGTFLLMSATLGDMRVITDGLRGWDGRSERVPATGHAVLFGRSIAAKLPEDLSAELALMVMDVCGAPALVARVVQEYAARPGADRAPTVCVLGGAGKSGSLSLAAAAEAGAGRRIAVVPVEREAALLEGSGLAEEVVVADARSPLGLSEAVAAAGGPADVTVVCVDVPGCEQPAILSTAQGGTIVFFSMATSFAAAALGAEGVAADVRMLVGNGYTPGHAAYALDLVRREPAVRRLFEGRLED